MNPTQTPTPAPTSSLAGVVSPADEGLVFVPATVRAWREAKRWTVVDLLGTYGAQFPEWPSTEHAYGAIERGVVPVPKPVADAMIRFMRDDLPEHAGLTGRGGRGPARQYDQARPAWLHQRITQHGLPARPILAAMGGKSPAYLHTVVYTGYGNVNWPAVTAVLHATYPNVGFDQLPPPGIPCPPDLAARISQTWADRQWMVGSRLASQLVMIARDGNDPAGWFTGPKPANRRALPIEHLTDRRWLHHPDAWPVLAQLSQLLPVNTYPDQGIAGQVRAARTRLGYTQAGLAAAISAHTGVPVTATHIGALERAELPPPTATLILDTLPTLTPTPTPTVGDSRKGKRKGKDGGPVWVERVRATTPPPLPDRDAPYPDDGASVHDWGSWLARWRARRGVSLTALTTMANTHYQLGLAGRALRHIEAGNHHPAVTPDDLAHLAAFLLDGTYQHLAYRPDPAWTARFNQARTQTGWTQQATIIRLGLAGPACPQPGYPILDRITTGDYPLTTGQQARYLTQLTQPKQPEQPGQGGIG